MATDGVMFRVSTATWNLVASMPRRLTFSRRSYAPNGSEATALSSSADVGACVGERADDHVAADSGKAIEVSYLHFLRGSLFGAR